MSTMAMQLKAGSSQEARGAKSLSCWSHARCTSHPKSLFCQWSCFTISLWLSAETQIWLKLQICWYLCWYRQHTFEGVWAPSLYLLVLLEDLTSGSMPRKPQNQQRCLEFSSNSISVLDCHPQRNTPSYMSMCSWSHLIFRNAWINRMFS